MLATVLLRCLNLCAGGAASILNTCMKTYFEFMEAFSSPEWVKKSYGSYAGQGTEFTWIALIGNKIYKTGSMGAVNIKDAKSVVIKLAQKMNRAIDTMKILGKDSKVMAEVDIAKMSESSVGRGSMGDLGDLDRPSLKRTKKKK